MTKKTQNLIYFIILLLSAYYIYTSKSFIVNKLAKISPKYLILITIFSFLNIYFHSYKLKLLTNLFGQNLPFKEWFGLAISKSMFNYTLPAKSGNIAIAIYLKKKYGFNYTKYLALFSGFFFIEHIYFSIFGFLSTILFGIFFNHYLKSLLIFFSITTFAFSAGFLTYKYLSQKKINKTKLLEKYIEKWEKSGKYFTIFFEIKNLFYLKYLLAALATFISMTFSLYYALKALNTTPPFTGLLIFIAIRDLSHLISFTPGSLGIREAVTVLGLKFLKIPFNFSLLASLIERTIEMIIIFFFGAIFSKQLLKNVNIKKELNSSDENDINFKQ